MGEIVAAGNFIPPVGFYGSFVRPGDQREGQWLFRVALALEAPEVVWGLKELTASYGELPALWKGEHRDPDLSLIENLDEVSCDPGPEELKFLRELRAWGNDHHIGYEWIWPPATKVVESLYRHGLAVEDTDLLLHLFVSPDNSHEVLHVQPLGELRVIAGRWDPQMQTFKEFEARLSLGLMDAFRQHLKEKLKEYRVRVEQQMLEAGFVKRPARRQGGDPFRPYRWLVRHVVLGENMTEIAAGAEPRHLHGKAADDEALHRATVEKAVKKSAKECGIDLAAT